MGSAAHKRVSGDLSPPPRPHPRPAPAPRAHLDLGVKAAQAAADAALEHGVVIVVGIAQGLLEALQGLLEEAEAQEGIAHAQADLAAELGAGPGARQAEAGLAVGDGLVELAELLVAARQVQVALQKEVSILQLPSRVDLHHSKLPRVGAGRSAGPPSLTPGPPPCLTAKASRESSALWPWARLGAPLRPIALTFRPQPTCATHPPSTPSPKPGAQAPPQAPTQNPKREGWNLAARPSPEMAKP